MAQRFSQVAKMLAKRGYTGENNGVTPFSRVTSSILLSTDIVINR